MPIKRLQPPVKWGYDTDTGQIVLLMREHFDEGTVADPSQWKPVREAEVRLTIASVDVHDIPPEPPPVDVPPPEI